MLAFTAFSLNLYSEVFYPVMSRVSEVTPSPFDVRTPRDDDHPIEPRLDYATVLDQAKAEAGRRGWQAPAGGIFYSPEYGLYGVGFYAPGGTPADVIAKLNGEINRILGTPALRERIAALGGEPAPMSPTQFAAKAAEDSRRFGAIIKERKIVGD